MRPILHAMNEQACEVNALFIQGTRWCANQCKGCYSKAYLGANFQTPWWEQEKLFNQFYWNKEGYWANQITISIDKLPGLNSPLYSGASGHMLHWFFYPISSITADRRDKSDRPEVHMTAHSLDDVRSYVNTWGGKSIKESVTALDMLSLSTISEGMLCHIEDFVAGGANINYNHMIPADITTKNIDSYIERMTQIGKVVSSIYLIIFKESMGKKLIDVRDRAKRDLRRRSRLSHELAVINTLRSRLPKDVWRKVRIDGCLQDATKYLRTGESCSSNVSRFQVWPDGSVTGCPYAISSTGTIGRTVGDIMDNIRRARGQNEFERRCYLPRILDSLPRRPKGK